MSLLGYLTEYTANNPYFILAGFCAAYAIYYFLSLQPSNNPFQNDTARPPEAFVHDQAKRDKVLKQGFSTKKIPENIDAIIIGSGIGSLTTAGLLARAGKRVLVLEQHDRAGGCCHTFIEDGFEFDVGIHYVGQVVGDTELSAVLRQLTDGQLRFEKLEKAFDVAALGEPGKAKLYNIYEGKNEQKEAMLKYFPEERAAIEAYYQKLQDVERSTLGGIIPKSLPNWLSNFLIASGIIHIFTNYYKYTSETLQEAIDDLTTNEDLKLLMCYNFGDYGTLPKNSSFAFHALLVNHFMRDGAYYPVNGASEIAFHMIPGIERAGGKVLVRAPVKKVCFDTEGKTTGVIVHKGGEDHHISANIVVSGAGVLNTFHNLVPKEIGVKSPIYKLLETKKVQGGIGAISVFIGLKGTAKELGLKKQNIWAFPGLNINEECQKYLNKTTKEIEDEDYIPLIFSSFPSAKDPEWEAKYPGKSTCALVSLVNYEWFKIWENERVMHRGEEYNSFKDAIGKKMWKQTLQLFPHLEDKVEYFEVGSPLSNNYYLGATAGEIYGLDHDKMRFSAEINSLLRPETGIPGLFLTGQDVFSCGFAGGLFGGVICAGKVLNRNVLIDMLWYKKQVQAELKKS